VSSFTLARRAAARLPNLAALRPVLLALTTPLVLLALWQIACLAQLAPPHMLPSPADVLARFHSELTGGTFWQDVSASLSRALTGFVLGSAAGLALGLLLGLSRIAERLIGPTFVAYRQVALFAWVPLLSTWFGGGETGKLAFVALAAFAPCVVNTWRAVRAIPPSLRELAAVLTFGRLDTLRLVTLPGALPGIATGLRSALIYAWVGTVGAELFLDIAPGLGGRLNEGRDQFEVDLMLVALALFALLGLFFSQLAVYLERRLVRWTMR
jgi:sulfonate transport system permease protein